MTQSRHILPPRRAWSASDDDRLRAIYPDHTAGECARVLDRSVRSVYLRARLLALAKSAAFLESDRSGRIQRGRADPRMVAGQFPKGHVPRNKGLRRPGWAPGRMAETQFKKGRPAPLARNYVPIGSLRVSKDGQLERKVTDDPAFVPARRWVAVARLVWQAEHGPIPRGHVVRFKRGLATTQEQLITVDRLECISKSDNMRRNSVHRLPPEVRGLVRIKGAITRQTNRIVREHETT